jgi:hypothetical protein
MASIYHKGESKTIWIRFQNEAVQWKGKPTAYKWSNFGDVRQAKRLAEKQSKILRQQSPAAAWTQKVSHQGEKDLDPRRHPEGRHPLREVWKSLDEMRILPRPLPSLPVAPVRDPALVLPGRPIRILYRK